jgi:hypothetical protein
MRAQSRRQAVSAVVTAVFVCSLTGAAAQPVPADHPGVRILSVQRVTPDQECCASAWGIRRRWRRA